MCAALLMVPLRAVAADSPVERAPEAQVKAAFLLNFVRFAEWPSTPDDASLVICIVGDEAVAAALADTLAHPTPNGERVQVWRVSSEPSSRSCHVMYVAASEIRHFAPILDAVRGRPILTVSDANRFAKSGGMIELFVDAGHMRFAVNVDAVQQAHVHLGSRLLGLAKIVRDDHGQ